METLKFETQVNEPRKLMNAAKILADMPKVDSCRIEPLHNMTLLSIRGFNIRAYEIIGVLDKQGIPAERLYEE